jgi:hypothetical protein
VSARLKEGELVKPTDLIAHAESLVKVNKVGATPQENVLAVIHHFSGAGMFIR